MESNKSVQLITKAARFASQAHRNQRRKNKEKTPYIIHPLRVGDLISSIGRIDDPEVIAAAYLHDVVEDTSVTLDELIQEFGQAVGQTVKEVSDDKSLSKVERKRAQVQNAPHKSRAAKLVKLGDKLDNLTDLSDELPEGFTEETRRGYFIWSFFVVDGLRGTNEFLEAELDKIFSQILCNDKKALTVENLKEDLEKYYELLESRESFLPTKSYHGTGFDLSKPRIKVDPISEEQRANMRRRSNEVHKKGDKLAAEGHTCVCYLESYPEQLDWCRQTPCKNLPKEPLVFLSQ